jgi:polyphosphate glucokinase
MKALGIDIGGSALKGAPVDTVTGRLLAERYRVATPELLTPLEMA